MTDLSNPSEQRLDILRPDQLVIDSEADRQHPLPCVSFHEHALSAVESGAEAQVVQLEAARGRRSPSCPSRSLGCPVARPRRERIGRGKYAIDVADH